MSDSDAVVLLNDLASPHGARNAAALATAVLSAADTSHRITSIVLVEPLPSLPDNIVLLDPLDSTPVNAVESTVTSFGAHAGALVHVLEHAPTCDMLLQHTVGAVVSRAELCAPLSDTAVPWVDSNDVAYAVAALLRGDFDSGASTAGGSSSSSTSSSCAVRRHRLTGERAWTGREVASLLDEVTGTGVRFVPPTSLREWRRVLSSGDRDVRLLDSSNVDRVYGVNFV